MIEESILEKANKLLEGKGKLLYLTEFGSHLYGLDTENSDKDYRGVFLPDINQMLLGNFVEEINSSTGNQHSKNTANDIDIKLFSVHKFLKLAQKGEIGALDLLFSYFRNPARFWEVDDRTFKIIASNRDSLIDANDMKAFYGYAMQQAKKYGIKGSRYGLLKRIIGLLQHIEPAERKKTEKLSSIVPDLIELSELENCQCYCFEQVLEGKVANSTEKYLRVCGAAHSFNITIREFENRIKKVLSSYGDRVKNTDIDWKALSHAIRALDQCAELLEEGMIVFPLRTKAHLLDVKLGKLSYDTVESEILEKLEKIEFLKNTGTQITQRYGYSAKTWQDYILNLYMKFY